MAIVQLDKVLSGVAGNLESVVLYDDIDAKTEAEAYDNGVFVVATKLLEGNREAKSAKVADSTDSDVLMIHAPELMYDEKKKKREFKNEKGQVVRAYRMSIGDIISFTADLLPADVAVGDKLQVTAGKLVKSTTPDTANLVFEVIEDSGNELDIVLKAFALQVVSQKA